jgi:hypothetical protein
VEVPKVLSLSGRVSQQMVHHLIDQCDVTSAVSVTEDNHFEIIVESCSLECVIYDSAVIIRFASVESNVSTSPTDNAACVFSSLTAGGLKLASSVYRTTQFLCAASQSVFWQVRTLRMPIEFSKHLSAHLLNSTGGGGAYSFDLLPTP